jgi:hypothetical protein
MATKSLYEVEDVCATFMYALEHHNHILAMQAARELRVSDEMELLVNLITMAWLLCDPCDTPPVLWPQTPSPENVFTALCSIMEHVPRQFPQHKPQLLLPLPPSHQVVQEAITTCISHKCWRPCLRILVTLLHKDSSTLRSILCDVMNVSDALLRTLDRILYIPLAERLLGHIVIQCMGLGPNPATPAPLTHRYAVIWNATWKGRAARTFHVPTEARAAWNLRPKSHLRLQGTLLPSAIMDATHRTQYWTLANPPPAEDDIETWFYDHFPDDIPDEWSRAEIEKSHVYTEHAAGSPGPRSDWHPAFLLCWS